MSPSQWENGGSPAHDEMQADIFEYLSNCAPEPARIPRDGECVEYQRGFVIPEMLIPGKKGGIAGFADIGVFYRSGEGDHAWHLYEIKPSMQSVGGLIRQCRALKEIAEVGLAPRIKSLKLMVSPTVKSDDPLLPMLRRLWTGHIAVWNATSKHFEE
jgi:hypothetical protein